MRFLLILPIMTLFIPSHILSDMASPFPVSGEKPVREDDIREVLHSDEFKQMLEEFAPGSSASLNLTPEEEEEIIRQTQAFTEKLEGMTEEEQQQEVEKMLRQLPSPQQMQQQEPPAPKKETPPAVAKAEPKAAPKSEKIVIDTSDTKKLMGKLVKALEDIELKFESMPRVSKESFLEQKWAEVKEELPMTVSLLKRIEKKSDLLEKLASQEFSLLRSQLKDLYQELQPQRKKLAIPDTAKLKNLNDEDLSRAEPVTKAEKATSKKATEAIIKILSRSIQSINYGNKKLLEKYAPEELKKINEEFKSKPKAQPYTPTKSYGRDAGYAPYYGGSYGRPSSGYRTPSSSSYGDRQAGMPYDSSKGAPGDRATSKAEKPGAATEKDKAEKGLKGAAGEKNKKDKKKDKDKVNPVQKALTNIQDHVKNLEERVSIAFTEEQIQQTMQNFADLDLVEDHDAINDVRFALLEINPLITKLSGAINKFDEAIKKENAEIKDKNKKLIKELIDRQNKLNTLVKIAETFTKPEAVQLFANSGEKTTVITLFNDFLKGYQDIIDKLKTFEALQQSLTEYNQKANKFISEKNLVSILTDGTAQQLSSTNFKKDLADSLKLLKEYQQNMKKLEDRYGKEKAQEISGAAKNLVDLLGNENIPAEVQPEAKILKKSFQP
ncbi:MAG: hypothetical protein US13_C0004G0037 [candidate division TM6 bacterium GW2011_GWE2_36_25]|nr:MAG: hypothetical protein US03_C0004G0037 [candidate division TM6 bacterium GW2011_GWF2_36_131]KKQ03215.1 MAG: hypothetical protein US13_C0004G0037 [candidate division TM6 bacterium GW2011_GWE2_36_25]KKQ18999.1 MAG: hypothetical protein US32_C0018G0005 [candidate division TM6 bacterium GW2011_GWA2_36_9]